MKRVMKKSLIALVSTTLIFGCAGEKEKSTGDLLNDTQKRKEIMTTICEDHEMMADMMNYMMASDNAMNTMNESHDMFEKMMGDGQMMKGKMMNDMPMSGMMMGNMMDMMAQDSSMCNMMGGMMMDDDHMTQMMMGMMNDKGMMMDKKTNCKKHHMDTQKNGEIQ